MPPYKESIKSLCLVAGMSCSTNKLPKDFKAVALAEPLSSEIDAIHNDLQRHCELLRFPGATERDKLKLDCYKQRVQQLRVDLEAAKALISDQNVGTTLNERQALRAHEAPILDGCPDPYPSSVSASTFAELASMIASADEHAKNTERRLQPYLDVLDQDHEAAIQAGYSRAEALLNREGWEVTLDRACSPGEEFKYSNDPWAFGISILIEQSN